MAPVGQIVGQGSGEPPCSATRGNIAIGMPGTRRAPRETSRIRERERSPTLLASLLLWLCHVQCLASRLAVLSPLPLLTLPAVTQS